MDVFHQRLEQVDNEIINSLLDVSKLAYMIR